MNIDAVYTWVNHNDMQWRKLYDKALSNSAKNQLPSSTSISRFENRNEIYFSIKALKKFAPWIRNIFIVSNCSLPDSLSKLDNVKHIKHEAIFYNEQDLPVFNSRAIESNLHHIQGLSDQYLYFNDDIFLCTPTKPEDFFPDTTTSYFFPCRNKTLTDISLYRPIDYGIHNARELLEKKYNIKVDYKLEHSVFPLQRDIMYELENMFDDEFKTTSSNKFRSKNDIPPSTTLYAYYSYAINRGIPKKIKSRYIDIASPLFPLLTHRFSPLRRGKYLSMCLNEVFPIRYFNKTRNAYVQHVMEKMFED